jgi:hypothetical protein
MTAHSGRCVDSADDCSVCQSISQELKDAPFKFARALSSSGLESNWGRIRRWLWRSPSSNADPRGTVEKLRTQAGPREALQNSVKLAGFVDVDTTPDTRVDTEADSKSESESDSESSMDSIGLRIEGAARVGVGRGLRVRLGLGDTLGLRHGFGRRLGVGVRVRVRIRLGRGLGHGLGVGFGHGLRVKH